MKTILTTIGITTSVLIALPMAIYAYIGFASWVGSDPFDWIPNEVGYKEPLDFQLCRDKGGFPIKGAWTGNLKRCDLLNKK